MSVRVSFYGYNVYDAGAGNSGLTTIGTREFIQIGHKLRFRQYGAMTSLKVYISDLTYTSEVYFTAWRKNGSLYDRVGISENIIASLVPNSINTIIFNSPVAGIEEGDYLGYRVVKTTGQVGSYQFFADAVSGHKLYYMNAAAGDSDVDWENQLLANNYHVKMEAYMDPPNIVFIGDSITAGHTAHYSYCEATATNNPTTTIPYYYYAIRHGTYQNMGIGSQKISQIKARFTNDVINLSPETCILQGGGNDYGAVPPTNKTTWLSDYESNIVACINADIVPRIILITPWSSGSTAQMQMRDDWNAALIELAESYGVDYVDPNPVIGEFRAGGDADNLWNIRDEYDSGDGVHLNSAGHLEIAKLLAWDRIPIEPADFKLYSESYTYSPNIGISCDTEPDSGSIIDCIDYDVESYVSFDADRIAITFDFLKARLIDTIWLNCNNVSWFSVEHSLDNTNWTTVLDGNIGDQSTAIWLEGFTAISRRYWRVMIDRDNDLLSLDIYELLMMKLLIEVNEDEGASKVNVEPIDRAGKILNKADGAVIRTQNIPYNELHISFEMLNEEIEAELYRIFSNKIRQPMMVWMNPDSITMYRVLWNDREYPLVRQYSNKNAGYAGEMILQEY